MDWRKLLSEKRIDGSAPADENDLRSGFEKDYHTIVESAAFRRLQDKTQVFPLDRSDFIRTRLTHSLEVSSIGRSLMRNIGAVLIKDRLDPAFDEDAENRASEILACAGLIHDIGNPPFGHFGEEAIREWFKQNIDRLPVPLPGGGTARAGDMLNREMRQDLLAFEGNAQGLRSVSKLEYPLRSGGMNLTYGLLAACIKYPVGSTEADPGGQDIRKKKFGYFYSERELFRDIADETGIGSARSPLAFVLEAADDIAYATADIEDAFKKGFFGYHTFLEELSLRRVPRSFISHLTDAFDLARLKGMVNPGEYAVRSFVRDMQDILIYAATDGFVSSYEKIMSGTYTKEIIRDRRAVTLLGALKGIAWDYAFTSTSIYRTEIAANTILSCLLSGMVPAALAFESGNAPDLMGEKYLSLISEDYREVYRAAAGSAAEGEKVYLRLMMAADAVSGMTDSYARNLYMELKGFEV